MKKYLYSFLCLYCIIPFSDAVAQQKTFYVSVHPGVVDIAKNEILGGYRIRINDVALELWDTLAIRSHYPALDTIYYSYGNDSMNHIIISRFSPGKSYSVVVACCATLDFVETEKADRYMGLMSDFDSNASIIQQEFLDNVQVRFALAPGETHENLFGVFAEWSGFPFGIKLDKKISSYYSPAKGFFWRNVTEVWIVKHQGKDRALVRGDKRKAEDFWPEKSDMLASLQYRFFDNTKVILEYQPGKEIQVILK